VKPSNFKAKTIELDACEMHSIRYYKNQRGMNSAGAVDFPSSAILRTFNFL
jgi:hypothetical protein